MRFSDYFLSRIPQLLFIVLILMFLSFMLVLSGSTLLFVCMMSAAGVLIYLLYLFVSYGVFKRKLEKMRSLVSSMDEKYLAGEVIAPPSDPLAYEYYLLMKEVSSSAIGAVEEERSSVANYRHYLDTWVHEIKTPLAAMSLILDNGGDRSKLRRELRRADNITETIMSLSRLDNISKDKTIRSVTIKDMIDDAVRDEMSLLIPQGIRIVIIGEGCAHTDRMLFTGVLRQLLVNASKYAPGCTIKFTVAPDRLTYEDDGPGIPSHELKRVTEKGFVGEMHRALKGSGMGLYIVSETCRSLSIKLEPESAEGAFTRFVFSFPSSDLSEM